jgi:multiple sugar transport system permease protein
MLPLFLMLKGMGLVNSWAGVLVPSLAGIFGIFLVRQVARSIPDELLEAARIDGASELRIFVLVMLPLLRPVLATLAVLAFLGSWNDFMWPLIVLTDGDLHTLPVALASMTREHVQDIEMMMAGAVITVLPVLLLFLALQRHYLQGLLMGSVKG